MIETASIALALVATVGAVAVYVLMRRELAQVRYYAGRWRDLYRASSKAAARQAVRSFDLEDQLRQIERARSDATRRGNTTRAAKAKALRDTKTSELRRDLKASLAEPERQAA